MERLFTLLLVGAVLLTSVQCSGDIITVMDRVDDLNKEVIRMKTDMAEVETSFLNQIDSAKIYLRMELKQYQRQHVAEAMKEILQGESIEEMVRSQVLSEVRQLKRGNHLIKRQLHHVLTSNRGLHEELNTYKEALKKVDRDASDMKMCSKYIVDSEILRRALEKCKGDMKNYRVLVIETDIKLNETKHTLALLNQTYQLQMKNVRTPSVTTESVMSTSKSTSLTTTAKPEQERSRIIVAPWSGTHHQLRQINIHSNSITTYPLRSLKHVMSLVYISSERKLLIGLYNPDKIISSNLDSNDVITVRENTRTYGMAVDEERELVFLTTEAPSYTISRMTTEGTYYTAIIDLSRYGSTPYAIAVNTRKRKIYTCNRGKVFTVSYEGRQLQTLATGNSIYALTLDKTGNVLYYNNGKKLMSLSQNGTTEVATLNVIPWSFQYYRNTVYFSSKTSPATVGAVDVANNTLMYTLQHNIIKYISVYQICLVP